ncbi:LysM peptidoglycan-binding domain-containing M23 family metallopeptidase [Nostoc sp. 'Peltigera membranacea cyanobiont' 232]|uniref:LysM peptidoglycan-binding domain-containing M23 family metallopeptidase n=1 Tax=Nostoc sp. 'Peltigera membranacea cyanobiont' 232 TaxID=2014531 RepID=UPI000B95B4C6|nr:M23 family metallopeptidase [Nostoc sp. 'Peltigera membranacea cyanobiont' 232]OYE06689.1 peptidase [Nostoc sp. 'Peltigera membranacea cyanobiont' 232]
MTLPFRQLFLCSLVSALGLVSILPNLNSANAAVGGCPIPALSRFQRHKVVRGETLESIAQRYNLIPTTIIGMNPALQNGAIAAVGSVLQISPYNGIVVEVPRGETWRQVAAQYKVRADSLFEVNGCQQNPRIVFVPGVNWSPNGVITKAPLLNDASTPNRASLSGYPLAQVATLGLAYGWQINPATGEVFFHSGVDLLAPVGSNVLAIAPGTVAFASDQGSYGKLVIINHSGGLQSRYAQLDSIKVTVGQQVKKGDLLGTVGTSGKPTSTQPHLHFEVRSSSSLGWVAEDPKGYLKK